MSVQRLAARAQHPELQHIKTKWASLMAYRLSVDLFKDVLPINASLNTKTDSIMKKALESAECFLWHGNVEKVLDILTSCCCSLHDEALHYPNRRKFLRHLDEVVTYYLSHLQGYTSM